MMAILNKDEGVNPAATAICIVTYHLDFPSIIDLNTLAFSNNQEFFTGLDTLSIYIYSLHITQNGID